MALRAREHPLQSAIQSAMGPNATVTSVVYLGKDNVGTPMYRIVVTPTAAYRRFGEESQNRKVMTITFQSGQVGTPRLQGKGTPTGGSRSGGSGTTESRPGEPGYSDRQQSSPSSPDSGADERLRQAKDAAMTRIRNLNLAQTHPDYAASIISAIQSYKGTVFGLNNMVEIRLSTIPSTDGLPQGFPSGGLGGLGGGGGGGFTGPEYVKPDRRVVEDMVKGSLISLTGFLDDDLLEQGVNVYMRDHRRNFDNLTEEIDPTASVLEFIRGTEEYRVLHALRPESTDERTWVSNRAQLAKQGGLNQEDIEGFAVTQATVGADEGDITDAAAAHQFANTGSARGTTLQDRMRQTAANLFTNVVV